MGQSARAPAGPEVLDLVITNALILDHWGIVKADIGIRAGRIVAIGKAGNPDIMAGRGPGLGVGASPQGNAGGGRIGTAGGLDSHIPVLCPQLPDDAAGSPPTAPIGAT